MSALAPKPFTLQSPEHIAQEYGGNKQKIAQAVQMGIVDPTSGLMAGMFIDRMRSAQAQEQAPQQTVAQQVLGPRPSQMPPQGGLGGLPPGGPKGGPPGAPPMQMASAAPPPAGPAPQGPVGMAGGGLTTLPVPDYMFDEHTFAGGGIVAFAKGDRVYGGGRVPGAPEVSDEQKAEYRAYALKKATAMGLDPSQVDRIFTLESHYDPYAKSGKGNAPTGIGQLTTQMGESLGLIDKDNKQDKRTDPYASIDASLQHLQTLNKKYNGDPTLVAVAYNQGETVLNKNLKANNGALDLNNFIGYNGKPTVEPFNYVKRVVTPQTQMASNEPPAPTAAQIAQSVLPGIPSAKAAAPTLPEFRNPQGAQLSAPQFTIADRAAAPTLPEFRNPQGAQLSAPQFTIADRGVAPSRADTALAALSALNPVGTAQAGELPKPKPPQAEPKPHGPWPDAMENPAYNPMVAPTIMPGTIDPGQKLSNSEVLKRAAGSTLGAGIIDYFGGLGNVAMTPYKAVAGSVNAADRFLNMPRGYNDVAPEAPLTPSKLKSTNYSRENDPMLKHMLGDNTPAPVAAPAPVAPPAPAKETAEEAMARILAANKKENFWNTMAQAGFGMMAGTSPNAMTNIGAGLSAAMPGMSAANRADQELAQTGAYQNKMLEAQQNTDNKVTIENYFQQLKAQDAAAGKHTPDVILRGRATQQAQEGRNPNASLSAMGGVSTALIKAQQDLQMLQQVGTATPQQLADAQATIDNLQRSQRTLSGVGGGGLGGADLGVQDYSSYLSQ